MREFDRLGDDLKVIERDLARSALGDEGVKRADDNPRGRHGGGARHRGRGRRVGRFEPSQKLVSYLGLNPSVRQSGPGPAYHGRITKQGRGHALGMLVEAAWAAARARVLACVLPASRARRGQHVAAVATARKLAVLIWHLLSKGESYVWARPALHARKLRDLELKAGYKAERGQRGAAHAYNIKSHRDQERRWVEQAETMYARFVAGWNPRGPKQARRLLQPRGDDEGCAAGPAPRALLFATRSPVRERKITQIQQKNTCRSHQWSTDAWTLSAGDRCRSGRRRIRRRAPKRVRRHFLVRDFDFRRGILHRGGSSASDFVLAVGGRRYVRFR